VRLVSFVQAGKDRLWFLAGDVLRNPVAEASAAARIAAE
jgi:hypothetical protein